MILLLCMQPWFSIDKCDSKPIKKGWKCHILRNFSVGLNFLDYKFKKLTFRPFLLVLNHICQSRIKVACKVAKSFLTLFPVTLVKVEVQESSLHQMNRKKVYFLTCLMQNVQKLNMVGCRALNDRSNHYGPPCRPFLYFSLWAVVFLMFLKVELNTVPYLKGLLLVKTYLVDKSVAALL